MYFYYLLILNFRELPTLIEDGNFYTKMYKVFLKIDYIKMEGEIFMGKIPWIEKDDRKSDDVDLKQIDEKNIDIYQGYGFDYPIVEYINNALIWPEGPKGRIDLMDTYEISSVPEDPDTPLESLEILEDKGVIPKY